MYLIYRLIAPDITDELQHLQRKRVLVEEEKIEQLIKRCICEQDGCSEKVMMISLHKRYLPAAVHYMYICKVTSTLVKRVIYKVYVLNA